VATVSYALAIALVALPPFLLPALARSVVAAVTPPSFEVVLAKLGALGGVVFILPMALAIALEWLRRSQPLALWLNPTSLLSLDWLYDLIFGMVNLVARAVRGLSTVVEGEGAVLWALLVLIAAYVVLSGAIP
jgi:hypothetical protein